jgi:hypothetical protein
MKVVFVVGFSQSVNQIIDRSFLKHREYGSIIWVAERQGVASDLAKLKEVFTSTLSSRKPEEALVLFAIPLVNDRAWAEPRLQELIAKARTQYSTCSMTLEIERDFGDFNHVEARLRAVQFPDIVPISIDLLRNRLGGNKVICISAEGRTSILEALRRAGFPQDCIEQFFDEEIIATGRNSTLMEHLQGYAKGYCHMLYAWESLRTSSGGLVRAFKRKGIFIEANSAAKVVESLRHLLLPEG